MCCRALGNNAALLISARARRIVSVKSKGAPLMTFPAGYEWLGTVGVLSRTITEAMRLHGVAEVVGKGSNRTTIG